MLTLSGFEIDQVWKVNKIGWMQESLAQTGKYWKGTQRKGNVFWIETTISSNMPNPFPNQSTQKE